MDILLRDAPMLVVGAGIMGSGIAQVAASAGHRVKPFDMRNGAATLVHARPSATLGHLVDKGKLDAVVVKAALGRIEPVGASTNAGDVKLVVEAIVEDLEERRDLFQKIEDLVVADAVLATNTSSISVTAIANSLKRPGQLVGMHSSNPVPVMRLVEAASSLQTAPTVAEAVFRLSQHWGKVPVYATSAPGFIVNRIARPYYAEAWALLQERATTPRMLDDCMKRAGFPMGPCELMDLIDHDTTFAVTNSVYEATFFDRHFVPSGSQRETVAAGVLGRKSGRGLYDYSDGRAGAEGQAEVLANPLPTARQVVLHSSGPIADRLEQALFASMSSLGVSVTREPGSAWIGLAIDDAFLLQTDGRDAQQWTMELGTSNIAVFDWLLAPQSKPGATLALALAPKAGDSWCDQAMTWLAVLVFTPQRIEDALGLVVARTVAMPINEAADAVLQGVCSAADVDAAMKVGVNYPAGPFDWLSLLGAEAVVNVIRSLDQEYRGERYRVSPWLRRRAFT
jgi:3-hydroxybutyryl-CoA dehydrogenase